MTQATAAPGTLRGRALPWASWTIVIPLVLGLLFACGDTAAAANGRIDMASYEFWLRVIVFCGLFCGVFATGYHLFVVRPAQRRAREAALDAQALAALREPEKHHLLDFAWKPSSVIAGALVVLVCWLPYLVCLYPGTIWYDTSWQIYEHFSGSVSDHHPFMLVYLYGLFIDMGRAVFGSGAFGMFLLIVIQELAAATGISLVCSYLRRAGVRRGWCLAALLTLALFPLVPMMMGSMVKDTLQGTILIYFALLFCEVVRTRGGLLRKTWPVVALLLLGFAACVTKKTGVYVVGPALVACAFMRMRNGGRVLMPVMGAFLLALLLVVFPRLVLPALDVEPGGKQEMLAVPIQQVAHDVKYYGDEFTAEDRQLLNDFLWIDFDDIPSEFDYTIVDPIKDGSLRDDTLIPQFMQLWWRMQLAHPLGHLEAWLGMEAGWISTCDSLVVKVSSGELANASTYADKATWPSTGDLNDYATQAFNLAKDIPGVNVLYSTSLWATVLPFFALYCLWRSAGTRRWCRWEAIILCAPYLLNMVTLFVCPVSTDIEAPRYVFPMILLAPLFVPLALRMAQERLAGDGFEAAAAQAPEMRADVIATGVPAVGPRVAAGPAAPAAESAADATESAAEQVAETPTNAAEEAGATETAREKRATAPTEDKPGEMR